MAKPLNNVPPSSSVARLFDPSAVARATFNAATREVTQRDPPDDPDSRVSPSTLIKREFILTSEASATLDRMIDVYRRGTRTRLTASHVMRAVLLTTRESLDTLATELALMPPMKLPSNARGHDADRERFEQKLAATLRAALRRSLLS